MVFPKDKNSSVGTDTISGLKNQNSNANFYSKMIFVVAVRV